VYNNKLPERETNYIKSARKGLNEIIRKKRSIYPNSFINNGVIITNKTEIAILFFQTESGKMYWFTKWGITFLII